MVIASVYNLLGGVLLILVMSEFPSADSIEIHLQQVEILSPKHVAGFYNIEMLRITKFNRTAYVVSSDFELETDLDDSYAMKIDLFYSRLGNSDFVQFPARIAKTPICQGLKKFYESELKEDLLATSNFPKEYSCPWSKGKYWVKNFLLDSKKLSHLVMPGLWRAENIFFDKNGEESLVIHTIARAEQGSLLG